MTLIGVLFDKHRAERGSDNRGFIPVQLFDQDTGEILVEVMAKDWSCESAFGVLEATTHIRVGSFWTTPGISEVAK